MRVCNNCGSNLDDIQMKCNVCKHSLSIDPLISGAKKAWDPPIQKWAKENSNYSFTSESMREVIEEASKRKKNFETTNSNFNYQWPDYGSSKKINSNLKVFLIIVSIVAAIWMLTNISSFIGSGGPISSSINQGLESAQELVAPKPNYGDQYLGNGETWNFTVGLAMMTWNGDCTSDDQINWECETPEAAEELALNQETCVNASFSKTNTESRDIKDGAGSLLATGYPGASKLLYIPVESPFFSGVVPVCVLHMQAKIMKLIDTPIDVTKGDDSPSWRFEATMISQGVVLDNSQKMADSIFKYFPNPYLNGNPNKTPTGFKVTSTGPSKGSIFETPTSTLNISPSEPDLDYSQHIQIGMCSNEEFAGAGPSLRLKFEVSCNSEHDWEAFHVVRTAVMPSDANSWITQIDSECKGSAFENFSGKQYVGSTLLVRYSYWNFDKGMDPSNLIGVCFVGLGDKKSAPGTLAGSGL